MFLRPVTANLVLGILLPFSIAFGEYGDVDINLRHSQNNMPSKTLGNEVIYQILVDRFHNGNTSNDCPNGSLSCARADASLSDWYRYQGGDLEGILNKQDYIKDLGISRLWLTPIFENLDVGVEVEKNGQTIEVSSYHGYWIRDWFRFNPFFSSNGRSDDFAFFGEFLRKLNDEAGIGVILDTVTNHSSPITASPRSIGALWRNAPLDQSDGIQRNYPGVVFDNGRYLTSYEEDIQRSRLDSSHIREFHQNGLDIGAVNGPSDWQNREILENYNLFGLADLNQSNPKISEYLDRAHKFWLSKFPLLRGYRVDTIKHVPADYWRQFSQNIGTYRPSVELIGEYFDGGSSNLDSVNFVNETNFTMFDFEFREKLIDVFRWNAPFSKITDLWGRDNRINDAASLVTFLDSHDFPRVRGGWSGIAYPQMRIAIATWLMSRGVPCIYYGMEQDLRSDLDTGDPFNRPMMQNFDTRHEFYRLIQSINKVRQKNLALRYGDTHVVHLTDNIMAFERSFRNQYAFFVVSKNQRSGEDRFTIKNLKLPDGRYRDFISGKEYTVRDQKIDVSLGYGGIVALSSVEPIRRR